LANDLTYSDKAWLLFKPNTLFDHYHFNGTKGNDFSIYFTLDWLNNFIKQATVQDKNTIKLFLDSTADFLISHSLSEITKLEDSQLESLLNISFDNDEVLTNKVDFVFSTFIQALQQENITASHFEVSNLNRVKILEAEGILQSSKFKKFPSISFIANKVGISETKLKQHFKTVYGCTLLKYFQTLQMEEAKALLLTKQFKIAEIADKMGYQNSSKFSAAFKKETGLLPSEFLK
jgi:AraC-like DNA-binding protein